MSLQWPWNEPWTHEGRFTRPGGGEHWYGRLENTPPDGPTLHLVGRGLLEDRERPTPIPILHGETLSGVPLTIDTLYPTSWSYPPQDSEGTLDGFPNAVIIGAHLDSIEQIRSTDLSVRLHGLRETLSGGGVDGGLLHPRGGEHGDGDRLQVALGDDARLTLLASEQRSASRTRELTQAFAAAHVTLSAPLGLEELERRFLEPLCDLVTFATRRACYVESLRLPAGPQEIGGLRLVRRPYPQPNARSENDVYSLALNLARLQDPAETLRRWFILHERVGPVWSLLFSTLPRTDGLLENRFLNLVAFAEGYHRALHGTPPLSRSAERGARRAALAAIEDPGARRVFREALIHANSQTQAQRIRELLERCLTALEMWDLDVALFTAEVRDTRNWLNHWGRRGPHVREDGEGQSLLVARLEVILHANLMLDLALSTGEVAEAIASGWRLDWRG